MAPRSIRKKSSVVHVRKKSTPKRVASKRAVVSRVSLLSSADASRLNLLRHMADTGQVGVREFTVLKDRLEGTLARALARKIQARK